MGSHTDSVSHLAGFSGRYAQLLAMFTTPRTDIFSNEDHISHNTNIIVLTLIHCQTNCVHSLQSDNSEITIQQLNLIYLYGHGFFRLMGNEHMGKWTYGKPLCLIQGKVS